MKRNNWKFIALTIFSIALIAASIAAVLCFSPLPHGRGRSISTSTVNGVTTTTIVTGCYTAVTVTDADGQITSAITIDPNGQIIDEIG